MANNKSASIRQLCLQDLSGSKVVNQQNSGPWAFFRVLDKFRVNKYRGQDVIKVDLENKGMKAKYLIYSDRTPNPFNRKILTNFYLPKGLMDEPTISNGPFFRRRQGKR